MGLLKYLFFLLSLLLFSCAKIQDFEISVCDNHESDVPVALLVDGQEFVDSLTSLIDNASRSVYIEMYEFRSDSIGKIIMSHLLNKAADGVDVHLFLDGWGSNGQWKQDSLKGIRLEICDSFVFPYVNHILSRNHRKVVIVDGYKCLVGCTNIADYYVKGLPELGDWHDMTVMFSSGQVDVIRDRSEILSSWISILDSAKFEVNIINPYIAPPYELEQAIASAVARGVKVTFLFSEKGDIDSYLRSSKSFLSRIGANVRIYPSGFHHTKAMSVDNRILFIGSANMTRRATKRNLEENIIVYDKPVVEKFDSVFMNYVGDSYQMNLNSVSFADKLFDYFSFLIIE